MNVQTRAATDRDFVFARRVHHAAYRDVVERQFGPWDEAEQDTFFEHDWMLQATEMILADGSACGYWMVEDREADIHIRELVIHPRCQSQGIGRYLLESMQRRAQGRRVPVRLGTYLENRAVVLYERVGFREIGRTDTHILMEWFPAP
jgi:ribosomal protein S18 acetylase RimI-like enzyme